MKKALAYALLALALVPVGALAAGVTHTETTRQRVTDRVLRWQTARPINEIISIRITVNGHDIAYDRVRSCVAYASGRGVIVKMDGCGPGAQHVRFSAISLQPAHLFVGFRYR